MSDVVSLDLSKELYELSGWGGTGQWYVSYSGEGWELKPYLGQEALDEAPAYDLGFLVAKLDGLEHDLTIPKERLSDAANYLAELHIKRFKSEWRKVDGLPYEVSNLGEVRHEKTKRPRKLWANKEGYVMFGYNAGDSKMRNMFVHIAVAKAFVPHPDSVGYQVNHIDRNPGNNEATNLEWVTPQENIDHAILGGNFKSFGKPHSGKVSQKDGLYCVKHQLNHGTKYKSCVAKQGVIQP